MSLEIDGNSLYHTNITPYYFIDAYNDTDVTGETAFIGNNNTYIDTLNSSLGFVKYISLLRNSPYTNATVAHGSFISNIFEGFGITSSEVVSTGSYKFYLSRRLYSSSAASVTITPRGSSAADLFNPIVAVGSDTGGTYVTVQTRDTSDASSVARNFYITVFGLAN